MSAPDLPLHHRAAALRAAFDRAFADAARVDDSLVEGLLTLHVRSHPYAIRIADITGLFVDKKVTRLPSPLAGLSGIAGFRGAIVPVYDLGVLLGYPKANAPRWLVVTAGTPIGLAFDGFDGYVRVRPDAIVAERRGGARALHTHEVLQAEGMRPIVNVPSVVASLRNLISETSGKERS